MCGRVKTVSGRANLVDPYFILKSPSDIKLWHIKMTSLWRHFRPTNGSNAFLHIGRKIESPKGRYWKFRVDSSVSLADLRKNGRAFSIAPFLNGDWGAWQVIGCPACNSKSSLYNLSYNWTPLFQTATTSDPIPRIVKATLLSSDGTPEAVVFPSSGLSSTTSSPDTKQVGAQFRFAIPH